MRGKVMRLRAKPHPPECIRKLSDLIGVRPKLVCCGAEKSGLAWDPPAEGAPPLAHRCIRETTAQGLKPFWSPEFAVFGEKRED